MEKLKSIARALGEDRILQRLQQSETIKSRSNTHIGVIGPENCGKTTLLNGIFGQLVKEPTLVPSSGLPLRVVFDRTPEDERFECVNLFRCNWSSTSAVVYEFSSDNISNNESYLDELDMIFYLCSMSHFLTADDRNLISKFGSIPVHMIATQCDRVDSELLNNAMESAKKGCARMNLAAPIFADPESWKNVSAAMFNAIPEYIVLQELRSKHQNEIETRCRELLTKAVQEAIAQEEQICQTAQNDQEAKRRRCELEQMRGQRIYQEMKLGCSDASRAKAEEVRIISKSVQSFAGKLIEEGKRCNFDETFQKAAVKKSDDFLRGKLKEFEKQLSADLKRLADDAAAQGLMDKNPQDPAKAFKTNSAGISFSAEKDNEISISYLVQSVAGVGAVGLVSMLCNLPTPLSLGAVAISSLAAYGVFDNRSKESHIQQSAAAIRKWAQECSKLMEDNLIPKVQKIYSSLSEALHAPVIKPESEPEVPAESERLKSLRTYLMAINN